MCVEESDEGNRSPPRHKTAYPCVVHSVVDLSKLLNCLVQQVENFILHGDVTENNERLKLRIGGDLFGPCGRFFEPSMTSGS